MSGVAVALVLTSTFFHAGWNLLARHERSEHTLFLRATAAVAALGLIPAATGWHILVAWPPRVWGYAILSGSFAGTYFFALARAYGTGDFTMVYPVARSLPVLLVGIADVLRGHTPTPTGWAGMWLVAAACLMAPMHSVTEITARLYLNRTVAWVLLTAAGTTGYSVVDKFAMDAIHRGPASVAIYTYLFYLFGFVFLALLTVLCGRRKECPSLVGWLKPGIVGLLSFASYLFVLLAYQHVARAAYVVAFRQFSILIGVVLAFVFFRERGAAIRIIAACAMVIGLVMIALLGGPPGQGS